MFHPWLGFYSLDRLFIRHRSPQTLGNKGHEGRRFRRLFLVVFHLLRRASLRFSGSPRIGFNETEAHRAPRPIAWFIHRPSDPWIPLRRGVPSGISTGTIAPPLATLTASQRRNLSTTLETGGFSVKLPTEPLAGSAWISTAEGWESVTVAGGFLVSISAGTRPGFARQIFQQVRVRADAPAEQATWQLDACF